MFLALLYFYCGYVLCVLVQSQCVAPPMECPNENITFWLYTRSNENDPHQLLVKDSEAIKSAPWVDDAPIKILIHGYTGYKDYSPNTEIRPENCQYLSGAICVADPQKSKSLLGFANENDPHQLLVKDSEAIKSAPWVDDAPIKILIHGYTGYKDYSPNTEIRPAYMKCCDYNILSVDYNPIAQEPCYMDAARNTELVGKCIAQLIDELVYHYGFKLEKFHVIGFSLGGQTAGYIGDYLTCGRLHRITALDPAMPLFVTYDKNKKVDKGDAIFVDVLHTNALEKGKLEQSGHVDFYANGGLTQPGCKATKEQTKSGCDHARAPAYYAESITTEIGFYATKCYSWITYMIGWCELMNSSDDILFGEHVPHDARGMYFFSTNSESPYAKGPNKQEYEEKLQ